MGHSAAAWFISQVGLASAGQVAMDTSYALVPGSCIGSLVLVPAGMSVLRRRKKVAEFTLPPFITHNGISRKAPRLLSGLPCRSPLLAWEAWAL